jgi:hypothetical protein
METITNIKEFFTESEWDLIYDLLDSNRQYDDNEVTAVRSAQCDAPGLISKGTPYLVF